MLRFRRLDRRTVRSGPAAISEDSLTRLADIVRQGAIALAWLLAATLVALGAAGVVAGMDTPPAPGIDRTGRTGHGDAQVDAALDPIEADMHALSDSVGALGEQARVILASLSSVKTDQVDTATATGTQLVADIEARA
ncbi:MAG TPA: hypothetical protein VK867_11795, partial [Candidatus Limnocylindrales bacterium]|nr:hypothetical protein [Candidatus Limnocylindrales bacterium]